LLGSKVDGGSESGDGGALAGPTSKAPAALRKEARRDAGRLRRQGSASALNRARARSCPGAHAKEANGGGVLAVFAMDSGHGRGLGPDGLRRTANGSEGEMGRAFGLDPDR
jgi:hypothetical protein